MRLLILGITFMFFGCNFIEDALDENGPVVCDDGWKAELSLMPLINFYEKPRTGLGCEEYKKRKYIDYSSSSCFLGSSTPSSNSFSDQEISTQNTIVEGIREGRQLVYNENLSFYLSSKKIEVYNLSSKKLIKEFTPINGEVFKEMILEKDKLFVSTVAHSQSYLEVYSLDHSSFLNKLKRIGFHGYFSMRFRDDNLHVFQRSYSALPDRFNCEEVIYLSDEKGIKFQATYRLKANLELEKGKIVFGDANYHLAHNETYFYKISERRTSLISLETRLRHKILDGVIPNNFALNSNEKGVSLFLQKEEGSALINLNSELEVHGKIENIAPGEGIFASRFFNNSAYLVTFKVVDPLFKFDLSDFKEPKIVDELKMPGFSRYIHPIENDRIITLGKEGEDWSSLSEIKLFDVSSGVLELDSFTLSDERYLDAMYNHHRFLKHNKYVILQNYDVIMVFSLENDQISYIGDISDITFSTEVMIHRDELFSFEKGEFRRFKLDRGLEEVSE